MPLPCCCSPQWVGAPCGSHGPYVFYRAFRFQRRGGGRARVLSLGDFFFVRCRAEEPACIAELQLLWEERTSRQLLSSAKLYFLPEDTPQGRTSDHGEVVNATPAPPFPAPVPTCMPGSPLSWLPPPRPPPRRAWRGSAEGPRRRGAPVRADRELVRAGGNEGGGRGAGRPRPSGQRSVCGDRPVLLRVP